MPFINDRLNDIKQQQELHKALQSHDPVEVPSAGAASKEGADLEALRARLQHRIVGQEEAIDAVVRSVAVGRAGLGDRTRPLANVLLLGPTGVGKTELVRQLAASLRSGPDDMSRIDMSSLSQEHYMASLTGAPPGYAGAKESFSVFDRSRIAGDPYTPGITLFDEVEKAHRSVHRAMLQIMDHGLLKLANGQETIDFRNAYVFMTSNLGAAELLARTRGRLRSAVEAAAQRMGGAGDALHQRFVRGENALVVRKALEGFFDPEFINRIDEIVVFHPLGSDQVSAVAELEIQDLVRRCSGRGIELVVDPEIPAYLQAQGFDRAYGGRSIKRLVREQLATPIARAALAARSSTGQRLRLTAELRHGEIVAVPVPS